MSGPTRAVSARWPSSTERSHAWLNAHSVHAWQSARVRKTRPPGSAAPIVPRRIVGLLYARPLGDNLARDCRGGVLSFERNLCRGWCEPIGWLGLSVLRVQGKCGSRIVVRPTRSDDRRPMGRRRRIFCVSATAWHFGGRKRLPGRIDREETVCCLGAQLAISVNNCPPPRDPRSRMTSFKRTQRKYVQKAYRVRNWREYETGLRARGSLTVWLGRTDGKLANWNSPRPTRRKPGRQRKYSHHAIETTVTLGLVFGLASRQTEGFLRSLLTLLNLDNDVPDHSTISRRKARLGKVASYERRTVKPVHLLIDSSGLSVHVGQLRTPPKARDYRKLHLAVDEHTSDVVACELTSKRARDASRVASLVGQIERPIASAKADAAYDTGDVYTTLENHRAHRAPKVLIPPRTGRSARARLRGHATAES